MFPKKRNAGKKTRRLRSADDFRLNVKASAVINLKRKIQRNPSLTWIVMVLHPNPTTSKIESFGEGCLVNSFFSEITHTPTHTHTLTHHLDPPTYFLFIRFPFDNQTSTSLHFISVFDLCQRHKSNKIYVFVKGAVLETMF